MGGPEPEAERPLPDDLSRWVTAGLVSAEQARRIAEFEHERSRSQKGGRAARAVALLGALTLVSGVGSLVAYNWDRFGDSVKLVGLGVLLSLSLAATVWVKRGASGPGTSGEDPAHSAAHPGNAAALDVTLLLGSGLTLAGLSLVSQIYHQDGELWQLLFVWSLATAPLMSFSRTRFAHVFWYVGLFFSLTSALDDADRLLRDAFHMESDHAMWLCVLIDGTLSALLAQRFAASRFAGRAWAGRSFAGLLLVVLGLFGGLFWLHGEDGAPLFLLGGAISGALLFLSAPASLSQLGWGEARHVRLLWTVGLGLAVLPMGIAVESGFVAFVAFVIFWALAWYFAEKAGAGKNARLAVFFLGSRVVIASFELFESLLVTGSVLVGLGAVALFWSRQSLRAAPQGGTNGGQ